MTSARAAAGVLESAAVFCTVFVLALLTMERAVGVYDEGIILTGAMRVMAGDMIHRDFYANYGPAQFHLVAALFKLFGPSVLVERVYDLVIRAATVAVIYGTLSRFATRWHALAAAAVCAAWLCTVGNHGYPVYPTLLLALLSTVLMARALAEAHRGAAIGAGLLTAAAACFRYDVGFLLAVAHGLASLAWYLSARRVTAPSRRATVVVLGAYVAAAALPVALLLAHDFRHGALAGFVHDIVLFPARHYARMRSLPFPTPSSMLGEGWSYGVTIYLPVAICAFAALGVATKRLAAPGRGRAMPGAVSVAQARWPLLLLTLAVVALFYTKGLVRVSLEHTQLSLLPAILLLALVSAHARAERRGFAVLVMLLAIACAATAAMSVDRQVLHRSGLVLRDPQGFFGPLAAPKASAAVAAGGDAPLDANAGTMFIVEPPRLQAIRFLRAHTAADERILVGVGRHDKVFVNDVSAYFLSGRQPATKWHHYDPGLQTSAAVQAAMIAELEAGQPRFAWIESTWDGASEPNDSAIPSGVTLLDDYLRQRYRPVATFGSVTIVQRAQ